MNNEVIISNMSNTELKLLKNKIDTILTREKDNSNEIDMYLKTLSLEGKTNATIKHYKYQIDKMMEFINKPINCINTEDIQRYLYHNKINNDISDLTLEHERICINTFFKWLEKMGYISKNPCSLITSIKYEVKEREPLSNEEMTKIRKFCSTLRDKVLVEVLYSTGCRVSELVKIKLNDLDLKGREVHLFGKGRKHRTSFLSISAVNAIEEYLKYRKGESEYLIVSERFPYQNITVRAVEKRIHELGIKAGIKENVFPHRFRHTIATDVLNAGMPIDQVSTFLGHENISTTRIYAKTQKEKIKHSHFLYVK